MGDLVKIDDEVITEDDFIKNLKLTNKYSGLIEELIKRKLTVHAAKKRGIKLSVEELQTASNSFRLSLGLHRAKDTLNWMQQMNISIDDLESFISEQIYINKMVELIISDNDIEAYFKLNSPKFDTVDVNHMVVDGDGKAKEIVALLKEDPDSFDELVEEFTPNNSEFESSEKIKGIRRDSLPDEISSKLFNAQIGDVFGPFHIGVKEYYEIFMVTGRYPAKLDDNIREQIYEAIYDEWLQSRFQEHSII